MEAIKFDEHIGINLYRALSEEGVSEKDKAKIISETIESIVLRFPNLKNTATNRELSEVELRLTKEISLIKKDTEHINENIKKLDLKIEETKKETNQKLKELDLKIEETKKETSQKLKELDLKIEEVKKSVLEVDKRLTKEIRDVELKLTKEIRDVELKLSKEIKDSKFEIIKWFIASLIAQTGLIVAIIRLIG